MGLGPVNSSQCEPGDSAGPPLRHERATEHVLSHSNGRHAAATYLALRMRAVCYEAGRQREPTLAPSLLFGSPEPDKRNAPHLNKWMGRLLPLLVMLCMSLLECLLRRWTRVRGPRNVGSARRALTAGRKRSLRNACRWPGRWCCNW